jgi:hypothetical protein
MCRGRELESWRAGEMFYTPQPQYREGKGGGQDIDCFGSVLRRTRLAISNGIRKLRGSPLDKLYCEWHLIFGRRREKDM